MARFFFIRHGETDWNRQRLLQGHTDIELNDRGRQQAQSVRDLVQSLQLDFVCTSDLKRASQTAAIVFADQDLPITPLLREIHLGEGEGRTREEIQTLWPQEWAGWNSLRWNDYATRFPKGESRREGLERLFKLFAMESKHFCPQARLGFFTHGLLLRSFAQWAENLEEPKYTTPNCCVYEWDWEPRPLTFNSPGEQRPFLRQIYLLPDPALAL
jgi:broad specificity phosphatase PhoE